MEALFVIFMVVSLVIGYKLGAGTTKIWISTVAEVTIMSIIKNYNLDPDEVGSHIQHNMDAIILASEDLLKKRAKDPATKLS